MRATPNLHSLSRIQYTLQLPFLRKINFKTAQIKWIPRKTKNSIFFLLIWICRWKSWTLQWEVTFSSYQIENRCTCFRTWRLCSRWRWIGWIPRTCTCYLRTAPWMLVWESEHFLYIIMNSFYNDVYWCNTLFLLWSDHTYSVTVTGLQVHSNSEIR